MSCAMLTQSRVRSASVVLAAVHMRKRSRLLFLRLRDASSRSIKGISPILDSPDLGEYAGRHAADCPASPGRRKREKSYEKHDGVIGCPFFGRYGCCPGSQRTSGTSQSLSSREDCARDWRGVQRDGGSCHGVGGLCGTELLLVEKQVPGRSSTHQARP